jgi:hypothetical protein
MLPKIYDGGSESFSLNQMGDKSPNLEYETAPTYNTTEVGEQMSSTNTNLTTWRVRPSVLGIHIAKFISSYLEFENKIPAGYKRLRYTCVGENQWTFY